MTQLHYHREIQQLNTEIAKVGGLVEEAIGKALTSLRQGDQALAKAVRQGDDRIDQLEVELEERCLKLLALYQPVARDLRFIVSILKVNNELEHMGDLAESIAQKTFSIPPSVVRQSPIDLELMGRKTQQMVSLALDALLHEDEPKAQDVIKMDDQIDKLHHAHHRVVAEKIEATDMELSQAELGLLSVSRSLERIADMATSIAEDVIYLINAKIVRHRQDGMSEN